ncbi:MAG: BspA family leucine-rich repeat surface protein, partial [Oscillospiraceae bacterium]|nr:BspA family leucine-rich repeat surface protein [Oscillospiraceae bacterium]
MLTIQGQLPDTPVIYENTGSYTFVKLTTLGDCAGIFETDIKKIVITSGTRTGTKAAGLFAYMGNMSEIEGLSDLDTSECTDMSYMFSQCGALTSLDLSFFDTSKVTDMQSMFVGCSKLTSLDLSSFDTSKVTDMSYMFTQCGALTSLDLSSFDTSKVTNMRDMFYQCSALTTIKVSAKWSTAAVTMSEDMFN